MEIGKGFGVAALVCAILAIFIPLYGLWVSAIAIVLAIIAAFGDEKGFAAATAVIVGVSIFFLSPLMWLGLSQTKDEGVFVAIVLAAIVAPFVVIVLRSGNFNIGGKPAPPTPDYRAQTDTRASGPRSESSWRDQWQEPQQPTSQKKQESAAQKKADYPQSGRGPSSAGEFEAFIDFAKRTVAGFAKGNSSASQVKQSVRRFALPPQILLFALLAIAAVAFVPEARDFGRTAISRFLNETHAVFDQFGTLIAEGALLLVLAGLFVRFGKGTAGVGVVTCLCLIGYLGWKAFAQEPASSSPAVTSQVGQPAIAIERPSPSVPDNGPAMAINATLTDATYNLDWGKSYLMNYHPGHYLNVHVVRGSIRQNVPGGNVPKTCSEDDQLLNPGANGRLYIVPCVQGSAIMVRSEYFD